VLAFSFNAVLKLTLEWVAVILLLISLLALPKILNGLFNQFFNPKIQTTYQQIIQPNLTLIQIGLGLIVIDRGVAQMLSPMQLSWIEIGLGLILMVILIILGNRIVSNIYKFTLEFDFDNKGRKIDGDLFNLTQLLVKIMITLVVITIFFLVHNINILGILASVGVSGVVVAFAAQKTIEQIIGGLVLFVDSPFKLNDYISLPDGTFGKVESMGLRITKIRTSGKGTVVSVPNNSLTQINVENFSDASKYMSILYVDFPESITSEQQALIRQYILTGTKDIYGLDNQGTDIRFYHVKNNNEVKIQAQITFFVLSSVSQESLELRRQLLEVASRKIGQKLAEEGIAYQLDKPRFYVNSPISI
jgi:MscS family membrane protein